MGYEMAKTFLHEAGLVNSTTWYADNERILQDICISFPYDEWTKFQGAQLYSDLVDYLSDLQTRYNEGHCVRGVPISKGGKRRTVPDDTCIFFEFGVHR